MEKQEQEQVKVANVVEQPKELTKTERMLRVAFQMLVIAVILILGAWLVKLVYIAWIG